MTSRVAPEDGEVVNAAKRRRVTRKTGTEHAPVALLTDDSPAQAAVDVVNQPVGADSSPAESSTTEASAVATPERSVAVVPSIARDASSGGNKVAHDGESESAAMPEQARAVTPEAAITVPPKSPTTPTTPRGRATTYTSPTKVTPAAIVRAAAKLAFTPFTALPVGFRTYLTDDVIRRLNNALRYSSQIPPVYAVSRLPEELHWAPRDKESDVDMSHYIMQGKHRVKVLVIGEIKKGYLMGTATNKGSATIRVKPLLATDGNRLDMLLKGFATSSAVVAPDINRVGLHMSKMVGVNNVFFTDLYDARQGYKKKAEMEKLTMDAFRPADIVFAEGYIQRYCYWVDGKKKMDGDVVDWGRSPYRIGVELAALSLIATPRDFELEPEEEADVDL